MRQCPTGEERESFPCQHSAGIAAARGLTDGCKTDAPCSRTLYAGVQKLSGALSVTHHAYRVLDVPEQCCGVCLSTLTQEDRHRWPLPDNWLPKRRSIGTREQSIVTSTVSYPSDSRRGVLRCFTGQTAFFGRYGARKFDPPPSAPPGRANKQAAERAETSNPWEQGFFR